MVMAMAQGPRPRFQALDPGIYVHVQLFIYTHAYFLATPERPLAAFRGDCEARCPPSR